MFNIQYELIKPKVEAFQWTGGPDQTEDPFWIIELIKSKDARIHNIDNELKMSIHLDSYFLSVNVNDYIVKLQTGNIIIVPPDVFLTSFK